MKKLLLSFFLLITVSFMLNAQEKENPKFNLLGDTFTKELKFEANPVGTEKIQVWIYPTNKKPEANEKIIQFFTINRGKQTMKIDLSELPAGDYSFDIMQGLKGGVYLKYFRKD